MNESRMIQLAEELLRRAKVGKVAWEVGEMRNSYRVTLPDMALVINREGALYTLSLVDDDRRIIDRLYSAKAYDPEFQLLQGIYDLARGRTLPSSGETVERAMGYLKSSRAN